MGMPCNPDSGTSRYGRNRSEESPQVTRAVHCCDNVGITIPEGGIFGFLGPNGAEKTTTIRMISGVLIPD
jgi:ABC-type multidrug transport system ATPase subunit